MIRNLILNKKFDTQKENIKLSPEITGKLFSIGITVSCDNIDKELLNKKLEEYLLNEIKNENPESYFQIGKLYFDKEDYENSYYYFKQGYEKYQDFQCMFQLSVQSYDGLGCQIDPEFGCLLMKEIVDSNENELSVDLYYAAAYNLGRAYYEGFGVVQSDEEAERLWLIAADDGNPVGSISAQSALGFFYSTPEHFNLSKSFFWHSEACGNGSVESQASIGVMYLYGLGVPKDWQASLLCLTESSERGSIFAKGNLCYYFFQRKLYTKAAELAAQVSQLTQENITNVSQNSSMIISENCEKGISIACFIYARCLQKGLGVQKNEELYMQFYHKAIHWNSNIASDFQRLIEMGQL